VTWSEHKYCRLQSCVSISDNIPSTAVLTVVNVCETVTVLVLIKGTYLTCTSQNSCLCLQDTIVPAESK
jgi:hypothetical protein